MITKAFDPANYLDDEEAVEGYLKEAFETGDTAFIADALGVVSRFREMNELSKSPRLRLL